MAWFEKCARDEQATGDLDERLTLADWQESFAAWRLLMKVMTKVLTTPGGVRRGGDLVECELDEETAQELLAFGSTKH